MDIEHAIWWQVYPLGACGAPIHERYANEPRLEHRLRRLEGWLDHLVALGCNGLLLGPIFDSVSHGYDTLDHYRIDPRLGDDADFDSLVAQCRARGVHLVLDGVFNHVAASHELVGHGLASGAWEGHESLVTLAHGDARVVDLVVNVMLHWLRRGIAGWRLDVAYAVPTWFWREVLGRVRAEFPDALFLGEVIHGDYAAIVAESSLDTVTQYELWKAIWSSIRDRNLWELAWALQRHAAFCEEFVPQTFVGNHDVDRIASLIGDSGAALAAVLLFTLPGLPSIYYGDERAFRGVKGTGFRADEPLRPELPDSPDALRGGEWLQALYTDAVGVRRRNPWLTRGAVCVTAKENLAMTYRVAGEGHVADVAVQLDPASVSVTIDGASALVWKSS